MGSRSVQREKGEVRLPWIPAGKDWSCPPQAGRVTQPGPLEVFVPDTGTPTAQRDDWSIKIQLQQKQGKPF